MASITRSINFDTMARGMDEKLPEGWLTDNARGYVEIYAGSLYGTNSSSNVIELERNVGDAANLYTYISTQLGKPVSIDFDYAARAGVTSNSAINVIVNGQVIGTVNSGSTDFTHHQLSFTGNGQAMRVEFQAADSNSLGGLLDNISVSAPYADVNPEGNLIKNGSFENVSGLNSTGYGYVGNSEIVGWTDTKGLQVDLHNDSRSGVLATDGKNWLDLGGSPGNNLIGQNVQGVVTGHFYKLAFDAGDLKSTDDNTAQDNTVNVFWGGVKVASINPSDGYMSHYEFNLVGGAGNGNNRLEFEGAGKLDNFGVSIDSVTLVPSASFNLIQNGSFEDISGLTNQSYGYSGNAAAAGWTDARGLQVEIVNTARGGVNPTDGTNWADLDASPGNNLIGQNVQGVLNGQTYKLAFDAGDIKNGDDNSSKDNSVTVYWGGEKVASINPTDGYMSHYEFNLVGGAGNGNNRLEFEGGGNVDYIGASIDSVSLVHVATDAPATPIAAADMTDASDTGVSNTDNITRESTPSFLVDNKDDLPVNLYVNGIKVNTTYDPTTNIVTPSGPIPDGTFNITYTLGDAPNESGQSPALPILIDTQAPAQPASAPDMTAATDSGISDTDNNTKDKTPDFEVTVPSGTTPSLYVDGLKVPASFDAVKNLLTPNEPLTDGVHAISYTLTDLAGNESSPSAELPIEIDTVANLPSGAAPDMTVATDFGLSNSDDITSDNMPDFEIQVPVGYAPNLYIDGVKVAATFNPLSSTLTPVNAIVDGVHTISYTLTDTAGNESAQSAPLPILIDTVASNIYSALDMTAETDTGASNVDDLTRDNTPDFAIEDPAGNQPTLYIDGVKVAATYNAQTQTLTPNAPIPDGAHTVSYTLTDVAGNESAKSTPLPIVIETTPVNTSPVAVDDSITVVAEGAFALTPEMGIQVLSNDTDADGDPLTIISKQNVVGGSIDYVDGVPIFTPTPGYTGPASFEYTVSDGKGGTDTAVITLNIMAPMNAAPDAKDDTVVATKSGQIVINPADLLANDTDANGDPLTGISLQDPVNGAVEYINGQVIFTPTAGYSGPASFTYTVTDGKGGIDTATVNLTVVAESVQSDYLLHFNDYKESWDATPPTGWFTDNSNGLIEVAASDFYAIPGPVSNVLEVERHPGDAGNFYTFVNSTKGQAITLSFDYSARGGFAEGNESAINILVNGEVIETVNTHIVGFTHFEFSIPGTGEPVRIEFQSLDSNRYGGLLDNIYLSTPPLTEPVITNTAPSAHEDNISAENTGKIIINPSDLLANDKDADGNSLQGVSVQDAINGSVEYVDGRVVFTPTAGYAGPASFTYTVTDGKEGFDTATVNLTIVAPPPPVMTTLNFNAMSTGLNVAPPAGWFSDNPNGLIEVLPSNIYGIPGPVSNVLEIESGRGDQSNFYTFVNTVYGEDITLTFDYSARAGYSAGNDSAIHILVNGQQVETVDTHVVGFTNFTYQIPGTGEPMRIEFQAADTNSVGGLLDNISISSDLVYKEGQPFNEIKGSDSAETLNGTTAADLIVGNAGNDTLNGGDGDDSLVGSAGDDQISGGAGNDLLSGGVGADTFTWTLGDTSAAGIEVDTITDFANPDGNDVINVKDLLNGESHDAASLVNYLHFSVGDGKTTMYVSADGSFTDHAVGSGEQSAYLPNTTQQIEFIGVDLTAGSMSDAQVIQNLLSQNKLITD